MNMVWSVFTPSTLSHEYRFSWQVEPYAYWQFDRKMLNRRRAKQAGASKTLTTVVRAAKAGAAKGAKARRLSSHAGNKRRRTE
jgi:ribosomal RNA-processing protein 12